MLRIFLRSLNNLFFSYQYKNTYEINFNMLSIKNYFKYLKAVKTWLVTVVFLALVLNLFLATQKQLKNLVNLTHTLFYKI